MIPKNIQKLAQKTGEAVPEGMDVEYVPYERPIAEAVDAMMKWQKEMNYPQLVESDKHWQFLEKLFEMFVTLYPEDYKEFRTWQLRLKTDKKNSKAINREGGAMMQHQLEIPRKFAEMVSAMFPSQKLTDKKFIQKLGIRMPLLKVPD
jgi:hypothetical protein